MKMYENENMERFIAEQRNQLAHDKQILEKNPTSAVSDYIMDEDATKKKIVSIRFYNFNVEISAFCHCIIISLLIG